MSDPYQVLGVDRSASDDEIKKAYRRLSRQYHPDANLNNPHKEEAEEKFKEVQQAYDQIMKEKEKGTSSAGSTAYGAGTGYDGDNQGNNASGYDEGGPFGGFYGSGFYGNPFGSGFGGFGGQQRGGYGGQQRGGYGGQQRGGQSNQSYSSEDEVRMRAAANYLNNQAYEEALHTLDTVEDRTAQWYYYCALAHNGLGNNVNALNYARQAASMDPDNIEYQNLIQSLENGGQRYRQQSQNFGGRQAANLGNVCCYCCVLEICCTSCGYGRMVPCLCI